MKLRDLYSSLDDLCDDMDADKDDIINIMEEAGYHYDADQNAFRPV